MILRCQHWHSENRRARTHENGPPGRRNAGRPHSSSRHDKGRKTLCRCSGRRHKAAKMPMGSLLLCSFFTCGSAGPSFSSLWRAKAG